MQHATQLAAVPGTGSVGTLDSSRVAPSRGPVGGLTGPVPGLVAHAPRLGSCGAQAPTTGSRAGRASTSGRAVDRALVFLRDAAGQAASRTLLRGHAASGALLRLSRAIAAPALSLLGRTTHTRAPQPLGLNNRAGAIQLVPATHGAGLLPRRVPATADGGGAVQHVAARASSHTRVPLPVPVERAGQRREWWRRDALPQSHVPLEGDGS